MARSATDLAAKELEEQVPIRKTRRRAVRTLSAAVVSVALPVMIAPHNAAATPGPVAADTANDTTSDTAAAVADVWQDQPVYVDPRQDSFVSDADTAHLIDRVADHDPSTFIAVLPAAALSEHPGNSNDERADAFLDDLVDATASDGVYLVVFGGSGTWGTAVGSDLPVGPVLDDVLADHTRSQVMPVLDTALTELGVPGEAVQGEGEPYEGTVPLLTLLIIGVAVMVAVGAALLWRGRRRGSRDSGSAPYRPSFETLPDESDSIEERRALAREDVIRFGEEINAANPDVGEPAVAADVLAAIDAYEEVGTTVDGELDDAVLRAVRANVDYGRWRLASARARLAGEPLPPRRIACFFDATHGVSVTEVMYAPAGGKAREVPVCDRCHQRLREYHR